MSIEKRYVDLKAQVADECASSGRLPSDCLLLSVSKTVGAKEVAEAIDAGAMDFGENRPDQLLEKHEAFPEARWHFIGNIQSRRIHDIVACSHLVHSLYKLDHAQKIDRVAGELGKVQDVLVEVNVSGEESKSGISSDAAFEFVQECMKLDNLRVRGLMTMAPQGDLAIARDTFRGLRMLKDKIASQLMQDRVPLDCDIEEKISFFDQLSMGMSEDWREAVQEGSTIVRLGRAIFSEDF